MAVLCMEVEMVPIDHLNGDVESCNRSLVYDLQFAALSNQTALNFKSNPNQMTCREFISYRPVFTSNCCK